jgi:glycerophosphoryl diester phosphodiesterase
MPEPALSFLPALTSASRPLVGAHRGASADRPENTPAAFAAAAAQGADFWELDVRLSADGVPMVIHDDAIDRTTGGRGLVADMTAAALESYGVPALATVLAMGKGRAYFNIELKKDAGGVRLVEATATVIAALRLDRRVLISSFDHRLLPAVKQLSPALPTGLLYEEPLPDSVARAQALGAAALHPYYRLAGARLTNAARDAGLAVIPWTIDRPLYLRYFAALGVNGIITNKPGLAIAAIAR